LTFEDAKKMAIVAQLLSFLRMEVVGINVTHLTNHSPLNSNGKFIPKCVHMSKST
jgi:hypothetical protein